MDVQVQPIPLKSSDLYVFEFKFRELRQGHEKVFRHKQNLYDYKIMQIDAFGPIKLQPIMSQMNYIISDIIPEYLEILKYTLGLYALSICTNNT